MQACRGNELGGTGVSPVIRTKTTGETTSDSPPSVSTAAKSTSNGWPTVTLAGSFVTASWLAAAVTVKQTVLVGASRKATSGTTKSGGT